MNELESHSTVGLKVELHNSQCSRYRLHSNVLCKANLCLSIVADNNNQNDSSNDTNGCYIYNLLNNSNVVIGVSELAVHTSEGPQQEECDDTQLSRYI